MRILLIGQCTLHWGRLEFGNIGNYYITETTFRELHRVFHNAEIFTTFQMTDEFCKREKVSCLPMDLFYAWSDNDLDLSLKEMSIATIYNQTGKLVDSTPYIEEVLKSDLIVDFSGEMWGDHAEPVGKDRFLVGLLKDRVAQLLKKPIVMIAGSQGPFTDDKTKELAKIIFKGFNFVANRESETGKLLTQSGFDISNVKTFACPAFLFEPKPDKDMERVFQLEKIKDIHRKTFGFALCGWTMLEGPYNKWPRKDSEYIQFAEVIEFIVNDLKGRVVLMSHTNGFDLPPNFKLKTGQDYPIIRQLKNVVEKRGKVNMDHVLSIDKPYIPSEAKAIIKQFDIFITGRLHASVASISQCIPTVVIMHGNGPFSHKILGFSEIEGLEEYVAYPSSSENMIMKVEKCWLNREKIKNDLMKRIPAVKQMARDCFNSLINIV